jgi:hypothetical protein
MILSTLIAVSLSFITMSQFQFMLIIFHVLMLMLWFGHVGRLEIVVMSIVVVCHLDKILNY